MPQYLERFEFDKKPDDLNYVDGEPLKLNNEFNFFHNKNKFRKELNRLQYIFKKFTGDSLVASGIRDTYLKEEYTENNLLVLFTDNQIVKNTNTILQSNLKRAISTGCYLITVSSEYILLIAKDIDGLILGVDLLEELFTQVFEHYMKQKKFDEYVTIRQFNASGCTKSQ
ncbi:MAG: hypothetical protein ACFFD1_16295 [Candidatus Thorarchaeota archaeon]